MSMIQGAVKAEIDRWIKQYPTGQQKSAVMSALMAVQNANGGYLTRDLMDEVADYLSIEPIEVYEVATFYSMLVIRFGGRCLLVKLHLRTLLIRLKLLLFVGEVGQAFRQG